MSISSSIIEKDGLICFWDFQEDTGTPRCAHGPFPYELRDAAAPVKCVGGGVFGPLAARFEAGHSLSIP